ncbi:MAG: AsmA family protein [Marinomonas sp.]
MVWLKRLSILIGGLLVLVALLLASVMLFVNPNDFKDELKTVALEKANVNLRLDGDISWSFFPWLGLELEGIGVALGSDAEILQFDRAEFGLAIKPLLQQKIQVNKVNLVNLKASLNKDKNGQGNWELDIPENSAEVAQATSEETTSLASSTADDATEAEPFVIPEIQLDELRIENAQLQYRDEQTNQLVNATLNVQINDVQWDKAWPMAMDVALTQSDLQGNSPIKANVQLSANLSVFPEREAFSVDALALSAKVESGLLPASPLEAKLNAIRVDFDLPQENVLLDGVTLSTLGVNLDAKLEAYQVLSDPQFTAIFSVGEFNPRDVISALNIELPEMSDDTAFTSAQMNMSVEGSLDSVVVKPMSLQLDETKIEANAALDLSPLYWDLRIAGANLDLDRYLPTPVEGENEEAPANTEQVIESEASDLIPVELIRQLNGHVGFAFDNLTVKNLKVDRIELDSTQSNGIVKVAPLKASLYEGTFSTTADLNAQSSTPTIAFVPSIDAIQIQPLLVDFMDMDKVAGATYLNGDLMMQGNRIDDLMASLQGDLLVEIKDGALIGTNLTKSVCEGIASVRKDALDGSRFGEDTPFEAMTFPAHIVNGQVSTPGLKIRSAGIEVTGDGVISLTDSSLNYQANVGFPGSTLDDACQVNEKVAELTFPIICRGQFSDDPAGLCRPDLKGFGDLFLDLASAELKLKAEEEKAKLEAELEAKIAAEKARLKAELEAKKEAEEEALKEKLKNKLKDLF